MSHSSALPHEGATLLESSLLYIRSRVGQQPTVSYYSVRADISVSQALKDGFCAGSLSCLRPLHLLRKRRDLIMQFPSISAIDCLMISVAVYLLVSLQDHRRRRGCPYPPGPRSWPIIGNLFDIPTQSPWLAYADMSKKYGINHIPASLISY
jgi:hypothetical protein